MASTDPTVDPPAEGRPGGGAEIDEATRQRLFEVLYGQLAAGSRQALACGVTPQELTAHLDERTALLRARLESLPGGPAAEDGCAGSG